MLLEKHVLLFKIFKLDVVKHANLVAASESAGASGDATECLLLLEVSVPVEE